MSRSNNKMTREERRQKALKHFECRRCGNCCTWPGRVRITAEEADAIAAELGLTVSEFTECYTRLSASRRDLELTDHDDGSCIFLTEEKLCRIHNVKPEQCRGFPWKWDYPRSEELCEGMRIAWKKT